MPKWKWIWIKDFFTIFDDSIDLEKNPNMSTGDGYFISFYVHLYEVHGELLRIVPLSTIEGTKHWIEKITQNKL